MGLDTELASEWLDSRGLQEGHIPAFVNESPAAQGSSGQTSAAGREPKPTSVAGTPSAMFSQAGSVSQIYYLIYSLESGSRTVFVAFVLVFPEVFVILGRLQMVTA